MPSFGLRTGIAQHPFPDRYDQAGFLRKRYEFRRRDDPEPWVIPTKQRLDTE
jgi:hypothetical protein